MVNRVTEKTREEEERKKREIRREENQQAQARRQETDIEQQARLDLNREGDLRQAQEIVARQRAEQGLSPGGVIASRPTGTPPSEDVFIANLPPDQRERISRQNALIGQRIAEQEATIGAQELVRRGQAERQTAGIEQFAEQSPEFFAEARGEAQPQQDQIVGFEEITTRDEQGNERTIRVPVTQSELQERQRIQAENEFQAVALGLGGVGAAAGAISRIPRLLNTQLVGRSAAKVADKAAGAKTTSLFTRLKEGAQFLFFSSVGLSVLGIEFLRDKAPFVQQSFNTLGEQATGIANDPILTPEAKIRRLQAIESEILTMEQTLNITNLENTRLTNSNEMLDIMTDLQEKKEVVILARAQAQAELIQRQFPVYDEATIQAWVSQATESQLRELEEEYERQRKKVLRDS